MGLMLLDAYEYYQQLNDKKVILIYSGPIWAVSVEELGETISRRLEFDALPVSTAHSIFSVFVEQMNNISLYSTEKERFEKTDERNPEVARGVFVLGTTNGKYFLQSGNVMDDNSLELIKSRIDYLNTLDKQELRKYYKEQLNKEDTNPESKGAGLGLTEIAKRASSKIEYEFTPVGNGQTFFTMLVEMGGGKINGI